MSGIDYDNYVLTFNEEFDSFDRLSAGNPDGTWKTEFPWARWYTGEKSWVGRTLGGNNGELELYMDEDFAGTADAPLGYSPFRVDDGILTITAAPTPPEIEEHVMGFDYLSGMLSTETTFQQQYGYFEIRADLPEGQGLWPSFWMVRAETSGAGYPEIDVFEVLGQDPDEIHQTVHWPDERGKHQMSQNTYTDVDSSDGFHTYGLEWNPGELHWYVDGVQTFSAPISVDEPMYLYVTLAVGGDWPGPPDESTSFPADMYIDYIRAYQKAPNAESNEDGPEKSGSIIWPPEESTDDNSGGTDSDTISGKGKKLGWLNKPHPSDANEAANGLDKLSPEAGNHHNGSKPEGADSPPPPGHADGGTGKLDLLAILQAATGNEGATGSGSDQGSPSGPHDGGWSDLAGRKILSGLPTHEGGDAGGTLEQPFGGKLPLVYEVESAPMADVDFHAIQLADYPFS